MNRTATLYVGADNETGEIDLDGLAKVVGRMHDGFTIVPARGYWRGNAEPSAMVIISGDGMSIAATIKDIKSEFDQESVGISWSDPIGFV
jgi:hypothetical protein